MSDLPFSLHAADAHEFRVPEQQQCRISFQLTLDFWFFCFCCCFSPGSSFSPCTRNRIHGSSSAEVLHCSRETKHTKMTGRQTQDKSGEDRPSLTREISSSSSRFDLLQIRSRPGQRTWNLAWSGHRCVGLALTVGCQNLP